MEHGIGIFKDDHVEARVGPHTVFIRQDRVTVIDLTGHVACDRTIKSYGEPFYDSLEGFARRAGAGFRVGRADIYGDTILYLYDHRPSVELTTWPDGTAIDPEDRGYYDGGNFGYALNLANEPFSEWGYAPFPQAGEDIAGMNERIAESAAAMMKALDIPPENVIEMPEDAISLIAYRQDE